MTPITTAWLEERGLLHDGKVVAADCEGDSVRISINDEWANERDEVDGCSAGVLSFHKAIILEGDVSVLQGGWISEVAHLDGNVVFDFCDRDRLVIKATSAVWEPGVR